MSPIGNYRTEFMYTSKNIRRIFFNKYLYHNFFFFSLNKLYNFNLYYFDFI